MLMRGEGDLSRVFYPYRAAAVICRCLSRSAFYSLSAGRSHVAPRAFAARKINYPPAVSVVLRGFLARSISCAEYPQFTRRA